MSSKQWKGEILIALYGSCASATVSQQTSYVTRTMLSKSLQSMRKSHKQIQAIATCQSGMTSWLAAKVLQLQTLYRYNSREVTTAQPLLYKHLSASHPIQVYPTIYSIWLFHTSPRKGKADQGTPKPWRQSRYMDVYHVIQTHKQSTYILQITASLPKTLSKAVTRCK